MIHISEKDAPKTELKGGDRGTSTQLLTPANGCAPLLLQVNVLKPDSGHGPYHYHSNSDNIYYVLSGKAELLVEGKTYYGNPGDAIFIPANEKHDVGIVGDEELRIIEIKVPADSDFITVT